MYIYAQPVVHKLMTTLIKKNMTKQINKVHWVDSKLENVLVSLHSLKQWASAALLLRNGELLGHFPILKILIRLKLNTHYCRNFFYSAYQF
jgi:hypothetical protein